MLIGYRGPHQFHRDFICFLQMNLPRPWLGLRQTGLRMRITLDHQTVRKGWILKTTYYAVDLSVAFTHEEKQIIRQRGLLKTKLADRRPATAKVDDRDEKFELRVEHLLEGRSDRFLCATPSKAKIYEEDLLAMLQQMKLWLTDNAETGTRTVVEL